MGCLCAGTHHRYLSLDCPAVESHEAWCKANRKLFQYPPGTFDRPQQCLCRGNLRYFSVSCPDKASHGRHADQDWYSASPVFQEGYMAAAREYHELIMAEADPDGVWSTLRVRPVDTPPNVE